MVDIFGDVLNNAGGREALGLADGVLDGEGVGGAVGLDDGLGDADEGGAAHLAGVHHLLEIPQAAGNQHRRQLGEQVLLEHGLELLCHEAAGALHGLEEDVAGVAVGHDHVHLAVHRLPGLHVAHEVDAPGLARLGEQGVGLPLEVGALGGLGANVEQAHLGLGALEHPLGVIGAHKGELEQILRRTLRRGAAVDEHRAAAAGRHHRGHGRPADAPDALDHQRGRRQQRPRAARGDKGRPVPVLQQVQAHGQGGVLLLLKGGGRVVAHLHHLGGVDNLQPRGQFADAVLLEHLEDVLPPAHQNDFHAQLPHRSEGAPHVGDGRVVAAHGVYDDLHMFSSTFSVHSWINGSSGRAPGGAGPPSVPVGGDALIAPPHRLAAEAGARP